MCQHFRSIAFANCTALLNIVHNNVYFFILFFTSLDLIIFSTIITIIVMIMFISMCYLSESTSHFHKQKQLKYKIEKTD